MRNINSIQWETNSVRSYFRAPAAMLAAAGLIFAGCNAQSSLIKETNSVETYKLVSVDGKNVPCSVNHGGANLKVDSGTFTIRPGGECRSLTQFVAPNGQPVKREVTATYTQKGEALSFNWKGAGKTKGTLNGETFTMNNEGMLFSYQRQAAVAAR